MLSVEMSNEQWNYIIAMLRIEEAKTRDSTTAHSIVKGAIVRIQDAINRE
jgi:hypothetical protein